MNDELKEIQQEREELEQRISKLEARFIKQFTALDSLLAQFNATSSFLEQQLLPHLIHRALAREQSTLRVWCAGCASGEEPYTLALIWLLRLQRQFPCFGIQILATDLDPAMGDRI